MSAVSESVSWRGQEQTSLRSVQVAWDDFWIRSNAVSTNLLFITLKNIRRINYDQDDRLIDFVRPIFEETTQHLLGDRLQEMRFEDDEDKFIFTGVISCENRDRNHSRVPTHLHILSNMRDGVVNKPVVADRVLCHLMNADTDRPVENYVSTRHKLLQDKDS